MVISHQDQMNILCENVLIMEQVRVNITNNLMECVSIVPLDSVN